MGAGLNVTGTSIIGLGFLYSLQTIRGLTSTQLLYCLAVLLTMLYEG